ncbi:YALI0D05687p KAB8284608.1 6-O-methylguanine DNA methyltransferase [Dipodascopsis tothii]|uniref:YALI0D05687p KAB8284608.1 6-O-methylguanine DNA methyltransferase n=1 Tax=Dipodascopsis tothii TaxID=44089 RepID=UPI0034CD0931
MPLNSEAQAFYVAVYEAVQGIPPGKVTTYGHIAKLIFMPSNSRQVGYALKYLRSSPQDVDGTANIYDDGELALRDEFNSLNVPWWRVISSQGHISFRPGEGMTIQAEKLRDEGIEVTENDLRRARIVSLRQYGWFPPVEE